MQAGKSSALSGSDDVVLLARAGNKKAVDRFLYSIERAVMDIATRYAAKSGVDADDLANEARLRAVIALGEYDPGRGELFPFVHQRMVWRVIRVIKDLVGAARLPTFNWERGERPPRATSLDDPGYVPPSSRDVLIDVFEKTQEIRRALAQLPPRDAMILLRRADEATLPESGKEIGISKQAVAQAEKKAMRRLREMMMQADALPPERA